MRLTKLTLRCAVGVLAAVAPVALVVAPASAKGPAPAGITLTCAPGTYSYMTNIAVYDKAGNQLVPAGSGALECGLPNSGSPFGYGSSHTLTAGKPAAYCFNQWAWESVGNTGGTFLTCFSAPVDLPKGGKPIPASDYTGPASITFQVR